MMHTSCFFCTTPFQIISALLLTSNLSLDADLYIVPQFKNAKNLANKIKEEKIFANVSVVDTEAFEKYKKSKTKAGLYIGIIKNYIALNKIVEGFLLRERSYDDMYISSKANVGRLVLFYLYKKEELPVLHYIDDGESSYDNVRITEASKPDKIIRSIIFGKNVLNITEVDRYLFSPVLYFKLNPNSQAKVLPMPRISDDDKQMLKRVFDITKNKLISEPVLILDILKSENMETVESDKLIRLYRDIINYFGSDRVIIKKHPRDSSAEIKDANYYKDYSVPMEALCIASDFENKILISAGSTAVVLPKLLFNAEPTVILLNELITTKHYTVSNAKQYYELCKQTYNQTDKFNIPQSTMEFYDVVSKLRLCNVP